MGGLLGRGGGAKDMLAPPSQIIGGAWPPWPPSSYAYDLNPKQKQNKKQEMLQYVTDAPEGPLCTTHLLIMLYLSVMFRSF